jgi:hypothetical protein
MGAMAIETNSNTESSKLTTVQKMYANERYVPALLGSSVPTTFQFGEVDA